MVQIFILEESGLEVYKCENPLGGAMVGTRGCEPSHPSSSLTSTLILKCGGNKSYPVTSKKKFRSVAAFSVVAFTDLINVYVSFALGAQHPSC